MQLVRGNWLLPNIRYVHKSYCAKYSVFYGSYDNFSLLYFVIQNASLCNVK